MGTFKFIPKGIKEQILRRIKEEGITVTQAAVDAGISSKTIYNRMRSTESPPERCNTILNASCLFN